MKAIKRLRGNKGSVTVEAALALPVVLCAFFSVLFIIKAVYTYEMVQHALNGAAVEIASTGYIYHVSGIRDVHDTTRNGMNERAGVFKNQIGSVFDSYNSIKNIKSNISQELPSISDSESLIAGAEQSFRKMLEESSDIAANPVDELKSIACYILADGFDNAKTQLFIPLVKLYMKKHLIVEQTDDINERLKKLNICGGFEGMDFSESSFLSDNKEDIDIIVRYRINLPLPIRFGKGMEIVQRARAKAWMSGNETIKTSETEDDIWSLGNFQRGRKIQKIFGANLPLNFPVIAKFEQGRAVMIKSMDLTAASYQTADNVRKTLNEYLKKLIEFEGQEKPWGSAGTVIGKNEIKEKELLLVIPKNELTEDNERILTEMVGIAEGQGVIFRVERYGTKVITENHDESEEQSE